MSDRLEDFPLLLFLPQDRLMQNSRSALKSHIVHKLRQKYTIMTRQRMTYNISDVDFRKSFFIKRRCL